MAWSHGHFHWNELLTKDAERAKRFYTDTIGWSYQAMPMTDGATYWVAILDGKPVAGIFPTDRPEYQGVPEAWMSFRYSSCFSVSSPNIRSARTSENPMMALSGVRSS